MKIYEKILLIPLLLAGIEGFGESYSFKVNFGLVPAGSADLKHVLVDSLLTSSLSMESSPWLSNLWTLSDSIISVYLVESRKILKHVKAIHEGSYHRNYEVIFSDSDTVRVNGKPKVIATHNFVDIPSLLYELSLTKFHDGDTLNYQVWDGRSHGKLSLLVEDIGKPSLLKPFSEPGWRLTPLSSTRKSRENSIKLSMLYSKSFPHKPLRVEIDTKYGNVLMRLEDR